LSQTAANAASLRGYNLPDMPLRPDVTVAALAEQGGRFLVVEERIQSRVVFNQPAGHVELGESLLEAVRRETLEETAWRFTPHALLGIYLWQPESSRRATLRFAFRGEVYDHDPARPLDRGILQAHWLTRPQLCERAPQLRTPLVLRCIDDYLAGRHYPLDLVARLDLNSAADLNSATPPLIP
jgi:8-oxo-dGTP pyrophosphatase MutT (NUDIX family)